MDAAIGSLVGQAQEGGSTDVVDLFDDPAARAAVRAELERKTQGFVYSASVPDGPPPVPKE